MGFFRDLFNVPQTDAEWLRTHCVWATQVDPRRRRRLRVMRPPWGLCVHTTGRGIVHRAAKRGTRPIDEACAYYSGTLGPHYVVDYSGALYQLQADDRRGAHVGISKDERKAYLSGRWTSWDVATLPNVRRWKKRWERKSPQHLYPTRSPNACYVSVELIPLADAKGPLWYTDQQHAQVALLGADLARRYEWPDGWHRTPRLVGHEDLDAKGRWDRGGGWDLGALRDRPRFDWDRVLEALD